MNQEFFSHPQFEGGQLRLAAVPKTEFCSSNYTRVGILFALQKQSKIFVKSDGFSRIWRRMIELEATTEGSAGRERSVVSANCYEELIFAKTIQPGPLSDCKSVC